MNKSKLRLLGVAGLVVMSFVGWAWDEYKDCSPDLVDGASVALSRDLRRIALLPEQRQREIERARAEYERAYVAWQSLEAETRVMRSIAVLDKFKATLCEAYRAATGGPSIGCVVFRPALSGHLKLEEIGSTTWHAALQQSGISIYSHKTDAALIADAGDGVRFCGVSQDSVGNALRYVAFQYPADDSHLLAALVELDTTVSLLLNCVHQRGIGSTSNSEVTQKQLSDAHGAMESAEVKLQSLLKKPPEEALSTETRLKLREARYECSRKFGACQIALWAFKECREIDKFAGEVDSTN